MNARLDRIEKRLDDMPKAMATAFTEAFSNARAALAQQIDTTVTGALAQVEAAAERRHGELMRAMTSMFGAVPTRSEMAAELADLKARMAKLEAALGAHQ